MCTLVLVVCFRFHPISHYFCLEAGRELLTLIHQAIEEGVRSQSVQKQPHLILLDLHFYRVHVKPLIAEWAWLWMQVHPKLRDSIAAAVRRSSTSEVFRAVSSFLRVSVGWRSDPDPRPDNLPSVDDLFEPYMIQVLNLAKGWYWMLTRSIQLSLEISPAFRLVGRVLTPLPLKSKPCPLWLNSTRRLAAVGFGGQ